MQWSRLENETEKAFLAFCVFIMIHPGGYHDVAKVVGTRDSDVNRWFSKNNWQGRKEAFFASLQEAPKDSQTKTFGRGTDKNHSTESEMPKTAEGMHLRHLHDALEVQLTALKKLRAIDPAKLSNSEAIRFLTAGANLERLSMRELLGQVQPKKDVKDDLGLVEDFLSDDAEK